jgi:alanyl-tRNA synthetase
MLAAEIRTKYLEFFRKKGHKIVASDLLVPKDDPTLLFTGAGMNQFKDQFMGKNVTYKRAASSQKCIRTGDLERVGKTPRHHTFFEMLGNFSFGDYFKREAIQWAWEFMTIEAGLPKDRLWISVYKEDDEAYDIWLKEIGIPKERIVRLGTDSNFWPADAPSKGPNGPCGPCSEIFYDWGPGFGCGKHGCDPSCDCSRFIEVWNLVFTEFERKPDGTLIPLPSKNIDTGMGLERVLAVVNGYKSGKFLTNFDTDLFEDILRKITSELGDDAKKVPVEDMYLIADHLRSAAFAVCDGVSPSNEKRGYVVRKLIRRAYLRSRKKAPFLFRIVQAVADKMKDVFPELADKREHIAAIIEEEEKRFNETLNSAMPIFEEMAARSGARLGGDDIFKLVDTYGLPVDMIVEEGERRKIALDIDGYEKNMDKRKDESRKGSNISSDFIFQPDLFKAAPKPVLSGAMPLEAEIVFILKDGMPVDSLMAGDRAEVILSPQSSLLYAEGGGQVGDAGFIDAGGSSMTVVNTYDADSRKILQVMVGGGHFKKGDRVKFSVDTARKNRTARNHTATHLLQAALRGVLGEQVKQSGSYVDDKRLRFDFTHMKKLSDKDMSRVESEVNKWIREAIPVEKVEKSLKEAKGEGALSFFGEKYGDTVRMVTVGGVSKELCGGTHVDTTAEIDVVKIVSESSVASGVRRIEAVTGDAAREWIRSAVKEYLSLYDDGSRDQGFADDVASKVQGIEGIVDRMRAVSSGNAMIGPEIVAYFEDKIRPAAGIMQEAAARSKKDIEKKKENEIFEKAKAVVEAVEPFEKCGYKILTCVFEGIDAQVLRRCVAHAEQKIKNGAVIFGLKKGTDATLFCAVAGTLSSKGVSAKAVVAQAAPFIGGGGGGSDVFAQAGGKNPDGLAGAMQAAVDYVSVKIN